MARVARLGGALLAETRLDGDGNLGGGGDGLGGGGDGGLGYFLVGDLKEPCDFAAAGFAPPGEIDARARPYLRLEATRPITLAAPCLLLDVEGEPLARLLAERLLIERNGSVSERLWRLLVHEHEGAAVVPARWLGEVPAPVWRLVRESVLKCS